MIWQFLLEEIVDIDLGLIEQSDLPIGWYVWRDGINKPWKRALKAN